MGTPWTEDEIDFLGLYPSGGWFCKYPNLVVSGDTITREQAEEVILRCSYNPVDFGNSDRRKAEFYQGIGLPLVDITDARDEEEEGRIREAVPERDGGPSHPESRTSQRRFTLKI